MLADLSPTTIAISLGVLVLLLAYHTLVPPFVTLGSLPLSWAYHMVASSPRTVPVSVNYHFTRKCNAECGFCFHTELTSHHEGLERAKTGLKKLKEAGMKKVNFAGGEPFLYRQQLGEMARFAKTELGLESVSIVSNGTKVRENWMVKYGAYIDILAISCDSFDKETNRAIGRADRGSGEPFDNVAQLYRIRDWCRKHSIKFKLNTVICSLNWRENMAHRIQDVDPFRWKVFQVLVVQGENDGDARKRDATKFVVSDADFDDFCQRHKHVKGFTPEPNSLMKGSYLVRLSSHLALLLHSSIRRLLRDPPPDSRRIHALPLAWRHGSRRVRQHPRRSCSDCAEAD